MLDMLWRAGQSRRCDVCGGVGVVATANASMHTAELARVNAERGWGIAILREVKIPKGERKHLNEYRALRDGGDFVEESGTAERTRMRSTERQRRRIREQQHHSNG
jgi:hypothetical protein